MKKETVYGRTESKEQIVERFNVMLLRNKIVKEDENCRDSLPQNGLVTAEF